MYYIPDKGLGLHTGKRLHTEQGRGKRGRLIKISLLDGDIKICSNFFFLNKLQYKNALMTGSETFHSNHKTVFNVIYKSCP